MTDKRPRPPRPRRTFPITPTVLMHGQTAVFYGDTDIEVEQSPSGGIRKLTIRVRAPRTRLRPAGKRPREDL